MNAKSQIPGPVEERVVSDPKDLVQSFLLEQFGKLSLQENLGLNSKVKRTFVRPA